MRVPPIILLVVACLSLTACIDEHPTVAPDITEKQQATAAQAMNLSFPPSTGFLFYHHVTGGMDDAIYLKIEMSGATLQEFLKQPPFAGASWQTDRPWVHDVTRWPEWAPSTVQQYRSEQFRLPDAEYLNVLIDDTDPQNNKVIYLMWHET